MIDFLYIIYLLGLLIIAAYSILQFDLARKFLRNKNQAFQTKNFNENWPSVTVQLPIYNEKYVVERLISNIVKLDYPIERLEIQVLDDSSDETKEIVERLVKKYQNVYCIHLIRRENRIGFKAGALKNGLSKAKGEFIAIFDADFLPHSDWLKKTIVHFHDHSIGMVQTRWTHLNQNHSLLTKIQEFALDYHFTVEQNGRYFGNHFLSFNGTAGIWRKQTILDAGNWRANTITEDLDLSYRAQMQGWKFKYVESVTAPAELPVSLSAVKTQQFRWNKGAAENFQQIFRSIWKSEQAVSTKLHATFHLLNSSLYLPLFLIAMLSIPLFVWKKDISGSLLFLLMNSLIIGGSLLYIYCYWIAFKARKNGSFLNFLGKYLLFIVATAGLSLHNSLAVLQGHFHIKTDFIRTPKFNSLGKSSNLKWNQYQINKKNLFPELLLASLFSILLILSITTQQLNFSILHFILAIGYCLVVVQALREKA